MQRSDYQSEQNWIIFLSSLNVTFYFKNKVIVSSWHFLVVNKLGLDCFKFLIVKVFFSFFYGFIFFVKVDFHSTVITINLLINYHYCLHFVQLSITCLFNTSVNHNFNFFCPCSFMECLRSFFVLLSF